MQALLANLYDRIITNRLHQWVKINPEQTAFQKGKGTMDQIFLLRLIINLIKHHKMTSCIDFFDLSKAFDRVSRFHHHQRVPQAFRLHTSSSYLLALKNDVNAERERRFSDPDKD